MRVAAADLNFERVARRREEEIALSDIGILNNPSDLVMIALVLGSPGLLLGAIAGALAWRKHRWAGALLGAVIGFAAWLLGWMWMKDVI